MISLSTIGFAVADGETRRVRWIQAMRRCILRMNDVIRYERLPLAALLARMDLRATREQRELTRLLHLCGERMENSANPQLVELFVREAGRTPSYGVLAEADREAFEQVLGELGRTGLEEQLRILSEADGRLYQREESLRRYARKKAQQVLKARRRTTLEPMNAYERHVIHAALQDMENITTHSTGVEPNRRVVIEYVR